MRRISVDFQAFKQANQQIFSEELLYVHSKILKFAKKFELKKEAELIRLERQKDNPNNNGDNGGAIFEDRHVQKKLQYLELSLDSKLRNFIFLIAYGFIIHGLEHLEELGIPIGLEQAVIVSSPTNLKVIAELLGKFINKRNQPIDQLDSIILPFILPPPQRQ